MDISSLFVLLGFIAACFFAALTGALFRPGDWYERLAKPSWRPPNRLFAPVWTFLYFTIAISGWLVWRGGRLWRRRTTACDLCLAASAQRRLDADFLRPAPT